MHIKNKSFKNLRISSLYKLQLYKNRFLMCSTCICVYIVLIFKLNINFFCTLIHVMLLIQDVAKTLFSTKLNIFIVVY